MIDHNLSNFTTLQIGGPAKDIITIKSEDELLQHLKSSIINPKSSLIIGSGSNLLVSDDGFDGTIIKNEIIGIEQQGNKLIVKSGTFLQALVDYANQKGLAGLESLAGIPGTVGGAIYGNAGAYGQTISDHLISTVILGRSKTTTPESYKLLDSGQARMTLSKPDCHFAYRDSIFKTTKDFILEIEFSLTPGNPETLKQTSLETIKKRELKYPPGIKCPGSFFKNIVASTLPKEILEKIPENFVLYGKVSSGALLESVGAKGAKLGDIEIAPYHANLFINTSNGTALDFYNLAKEYSQKVYQKYGIKLEPEVQLINLPPLSY